MEKTAVIYARFSSNNQREESIDAQLRVCQKYAMDNGIKVIKEYTDSAISGRTDQRPAFQRMIQDSAKGAFQLVLVYAHDRFSRDKYDTATYKNKLKRNGVRVLSVTMPLDDSPESTLMEGIMEGFAQYYSENLARSTKRGLEENALHCKSTGSIPLGFAVEAGQIVLDPVGAKAVQIIFEMYAAGCPKKEICQTLNDAGYKTSRGNKFVVNGLHTILCNERYKGIYIYDGFRQEGGLPVIINAELFDKVQRQLASRKRVKGKFKAMDEYLLSGKVFCGHCGKPMVGESGTSSTGQIYHYYKCASRKKKAGTCDKKTEKKDELEDLVIGYICKEILSDEMIEQIADQAYQLLDEEAQDKSLLIQLEHDYKEVSQRIENILEAIEQGILTPKTKDRLLDLEKQQSDLGDKIVMEKLKKPEFTKDHIIFWLTSFRQGNINDPDYKRTVVQSLVNSVFVYDDNKKGNGNQRKIVIALNLKNVPVKTLTRSDITKLGHHFKQNANVKVFKYLVIFVVHIQ